MEFSRQEYWSGLPLPWGSFQLRDRTRVFFISCLAGRFFTARPSGKPWDAINSVLYFPPNKLDPSPAHSPPATPAAFLPFRQNSLQPQSLCGYWLFFFFFPSLVSFSFPDLHGWSLLILWVLGQVLHDPLPPCKWKHSHSITHYHITWLYFLYYVYDTLRFFIVSDLMFFFSLQLKWKLGVIRILPGLFPTESQTPLFIIHVGNHFNISAPSFFWSVKWIW